MLSRKLFNVLLAGILFMTSGALYAAETTITPEEDILRLSDTVDTKKTQLQELQKRIDEYKKLIATKQTEQVSLTNQIALIENRIAKAELDIEAAELEIDSVTLEIELLDHEIVMREEQIERDQEILAELLREIRGYDDDSTLEILLGAKTFSDFYTHLHFLEDIQSRLQETLDEVQEIKAERQAKRAVQEERRLALENLKKKLEEKRAQLEDERGSKEYLLFAAEASETRFQEFLRDLRAESQLMDAQVSSLEKQLSSRLKDYDVDFGGGTLISWPLSSVELITTYFHDPDYPFRYLFEHSGLDIRASQGTAVLAAAPGIVASTKTGRLYGNYIVVIHANGMSTLYAHLSSMLVSPEQFVERGQTVGLSGGVRGTRGAGLSTGPHLHFEVRSEGIPVNPLDYLVSF